MRLVVFLPLAFIQVTEMISPGRNCAMTWLKSSGDLTDRPLTAVMTVPPVMPARAAGLAQITPWTRIPVSTGATASGGVRSASLVSHDSAEEGAAGCDCPCRACSSGLGFDPAPVKVPMKGGYPMVMTELAWPAAICPAMDSAVLIGIANPAICW